MSRGRRWLAARPGDADRGVVATELALLVPVVLVIAVLVVHLGRLVSHDARTSSGADAAARAAALVGDSSERAWAAAEAAVAAHCSGAHQVELRWPDAGPPGSFRPSHVTAEVTCVEPSAMFSVLGVSSERTVSATSVAVIEFWRPQG